jgi:hypothetical protein
VRSPDRVEDRIGPGGEFVQCGDEVTVTVVDGLRAEAFDYGHVGGRGCADRVQAEMARQVE